MSDQTPERQSDKPIVQMLVSMTGASAPEHETEPPGADKQSVAVGHEPDRFQVKGILYVPAAVVGLLVFAYLVITGLFGFLTSRNAKQDAAANPVTKAINDQSINERFGRISSTDINAPVKQPRLEMLRETKAPETKEDPRFSRSKQAIETPGVNPPEIRPEDLRPENYVDPTFKAKVLVEGGAVGPAGSGLVRIPIADAIKFLAIDAKGHSHALMDQYVPTRKDAVKLPKTTADRSKLSNGGYGGPSAPQPAPKKVEAPKKHDH